MSDLKGYDRRYVNDNLSGLQELLGGYDGGVIYISPCQIKALPREAELSDKIRRQYDPASSCFLVMTKGPKSSPSTHADIPVAYMLSRKK